MAAGDIADAVKEINSFRWVIITNNHTVYRVWQLEILLNTDAVKVINSFRLVAN